MRPMTGAGSWRPASVPKKRASPKQETPPSADSSQYPFPDGVGLMRTIGLPRETLWRSPDHVASPAVRTCPSAVVTQ